MLVPPVVFGLIAKTLAVTDTTAEVNPAGTVMVADALVASVVLSAKLVALK